MTVMPRVGLPFKNILLSSRALVSVQKLNAYISVRILAVPWSN